VHKSIGAKTPIMKSKLQNIKPAAMKKAFLFCLSSILLIESRQWFTINCGYAGNRGS